MPEESSNSVPLFELFGMAILRYRKLIALLIVLITGGTATYAFLVKPEYESYTVFQIQGSSTSGLSLSKIGMIGELMGSVGDDYTTQLLQSRELQVSLIQKFNLKKKWKAKTLHEALKKLDLYYGYTVSDEEFFKVSFYHTDPDTAKMAVEFILDFINDKQIKMRQQQAKAQFDFYQGQLATHIHDLENMSDSIVGFMETNKILEVQTQAEQVLKAVADVDKEIMESTIEVKTLYENYWNKGGIEYKALMKKIEALRAFRAELLSGSSASVNGERLTPDLKKMPKLGQRMKMMEKKVDFKEGLLTLAIPRLEKYRLEQIDTTTRVVVLDAPFVADYKSRPKRAIIILVGFAASALVSLGVALLLFTLTYPPLAGHPFILSVKRLFAYWKNGKLQ